MFRTIPATVRTAYRDPDLLAIVGNILVGGVAILAVATGNWAHALIGVSALGLAMMARYHAVCRLDARTAQRDAEASLYGAEEHIQLLRGLRQSDHKAYTNLARELSEQLDTNTALAARIRDLETKLTAV